MKKFTLTIIMGVFGLTACNSFANMPIKDNTTQTQVQTFGLMFAPQKNIKRVI